MKIKEFLKTTSEITNGDRIQILVGTAALMVIGFTLNSKYFNEQMKCINKDIELDIVKSENECLRNELNHYTKTDIIEE